MWGQSMFRVKICGITTVPDAHVAVEAEADAIGLNFYPASPRFCPIENAREIAANVPKGICKVGVFVNATAHDIRRTVEVVGLDLVQLHGDEPPELLGEIRGLPVMKAFRVDGDLSAIAAYLAICHRDRCMPRMVLIDALRPGQYGGTGATLNWPAIHDGRRHACGVPLVLAGGLTPANVAAAIAATRPWAVDTASGVEISPGKKSAPRVREFVEAALAAFARANARS
jgi:phosphoribosylanthranilate isomerase